MSIDKVTQPLRSALDQLRGEHARITNQIGVLENMLKELGSPVKRGPGRPKGAPGKSAAAASSGAVRRGPGRPKGSKNKKAGAAKASARSGGRKKANWSEAAREAARQRMRAYWAQRRK